MKIRLIPTTGKLIGLLMLISLASCKKDATNSNQTNGAALSDSSTAADNMYDDVLNTAFVGFADNSSVWNSTKTIGGKTSTLSVGSVAGTNLGCAIYSIDDSVPGEYPKTLTLNFGTGCTSADGIYRSGEITYKFTDALLSPGSITTVTFNQYVVMGYGLDGAYTITNNSSEVVGVSFNTQVNNGIITYPDAKNYHYSHNKTYAQTAGMQTPFDISDDIYAITGTSSFSSSEGNSLVFTTNTPLTKAVSCHNISGGIVGFIYNGGISGTIDFGDKTCDNLATLKIGNFQETIYLR